MLQAFCEQRPIPLLAGLLTLILEGSKVVDVLIYNDVEVVSLVVLRHIGDLESLRHAG